MDCGSVVGFKIIFRDELSLRYDTKYMQNRQIFLFAQKNPQFKESALFNEYQNLQIFNYLLIG